MSCPMQLRVQLMIVNPISSCRLCQFGGRNDGTSFKHNIAAGICAVNHRINIGARSFTTSILYTTSQVD